MPGRERWNIKRLLVHADADRSIEVRLDEDQKAVWLTQRQVSELFGKDVRIVSEHIMDVYTEGELERDLTIQRSG